LTARIRVLDVFRVAGRTLLAVDVDDGLRSGDRFRSDDGTEFLVLAVAFSSAEAWARGRRGIQVEVTRGEVVSGQSFVRAGGT